MSHWPLYMECDQAEHFWKRKGLPPLKRIIFSAPLYRLGWKRNKQAHYDFGLCEDGVLFYKTNNIKGWLQLNEDIGLKLIELKISGQSDPIKAFRIKRNANVYLYLWGETYEVSMVFFKLLATFCFCQNFDQLYTIRDLVGKGGFSKVYLLTPLVNDRTVPDQLAGKIYSKSDPGLQKDLPKFASFIRSECFILRKVDSPHVLKLYNIIQLEEALILVTEFVKGGSLYNYLREKKRLSEAEATVLIYKMAQGLLQVHKLGFVHRDLKLENVLIDKEKEILKLIDFGFAEPINRTKLVNGQGTAGYMAPEVFQQQPYTEVSDVFSLGVIYYCLVTGKPAFKASTYEGLLKANKECIIDFAESRFRDISQKTQSLVRQMLIKNPQQRITLEQVIEQLRGCQSQFPSTTLQSLLSCQEASQALIGLPPKTSLKSFYQLSIQSNLSESNSRISLQKRLVNASQEKHNKQNSGPIKGSVFKKQIYQATLDQSCNYDSDCDEDPIALHLQEQLRISKDLFNRNNFNGF